MSVLLLAVMVSVHAQPMKVFRDGSEFRMYVRKENLELATWDASTASIGHVKHVHVAETGKLLMLGDTLEFDSIDTHIPVDFVLEQPRSTDNDGFALMRDHVDGPEELHVGVRHGNDDLQVTFSTIIYHEGSSYRLVRAFGMHCCISNLAKINQDLTLRKYC